MRGPAPGRIEVWAPGAERVEIVLDGARLSMEPSDGGWWVRVDPSLGPGLRYRFSVDGGPPVPDPRSMRQPEGPHGPSELVDLDAFSWSDDSFRAPPLGGGLIYELHVGTFTEQGTFDGVIERLPYLADLGVTHLELMPVAGFPGDRGWGYDGVDLFAPHESYGGPSGLMRLVDAAHGQGLAVLLDVVYNHLGPDGNYLGMLGPYFTDAYRTPWGDAVNLDGAGSTEVRRFFVDNALHWLRRYHLDGLRLDAIHALYDRGAVHFLEQLADAVRALEAELRRPLVLIAESDLNDPRVIQPRHAGGYGMDAQWSDDLHHAIHALVTGERGGYYADFGELSHLGKALRDGFVYDGQISRHRGRRHGKPLSASDSGHCLVGYTQTHDQVGNRARGERLGHLVSEGRLRLAAALLLTAPHVPMLFMGEEWGASTPFCYFTDHRDPGLADAVREGRRAEFAAFGWDPAVIPDPQAMETFQQSVLRWEERERPEHQRIAAWYRALIALRRRTPELLDGRRELLGVAWDENEGWVRVERGPVTVVGNVGPAAVAVQVGPGEIVLGEGRRTGDAVRVEPDEVVILSR